MIRIGSVGSELALNQANNLQQELQKHGFQSSIHVINTKGDAYQLDPTETIDSKDRSVDSIEAALIKEKIDIAVNFLKDLPTESSNNLCITAVSAREEPNDSLIIRKSIADFSKPLGLTPELKLACSTARSKRLLHHFCDGIPVIDSSEEIVGLIQRLESNTLDAVIVEKTSLERFGKDLSDAFKIIDLNPKEFIPDPGQGILAYQCRTDDIKTRKIAHVLHHPEVSRVSNVERQLKHLFKDDRCYALGAYCYQDANAYFHAHAFYVEDENSQAKFASSSQSSSSGLAEKLYEKLKA